MTSVARFGAVTAAIALVVACRGTASPPDPAGLNAQNFVPPVADSTPASARIDDAMIRRLARGEVVGVDLLDLRGVDADVRLQVAAEHAEDALCREGLTSGVACQRKSQLLDELERGGWCRGVGADGAEPWIRGRARCPGSGTPK